MRVTFNTFPNTFLRQIGSLSQKQVDLQTQLATGQRITTADQDPMAAGRALQTSTEKSQLRTQGRNLARAQSIGEFSLAAYEQMKEVAASATTASQRTDGLTSSSDFSTRALEIDQLLEQ